MAVTGLGAFVCVLYIGFEAVYERLASLHDGGGFATRWDVACNVMGLIGEFPVWGTGLGSFEAVYPMYESAAVGSLATHAENEYLQLMAEMGVVGLNLAAVFLVMVWRGYYRCVKQFSFIAPHPSTGTFSRKLYGDIALWQGYFRRKNY